VVQRQLRLKEDLCISHAIPIGCKYLGNPLNTTRIPTADDPEQGPPTGPLQTWAFFSSFLRRDARQRSVSLDQDPFLKWREISERLFRFHQYGKGGLEYSTKLLKIL